MFASPQDHVCKRDEGLTAAPQDHVCIEDVANLDGQSISALPT
jgi:hypothetical protein